MNDMRLIDADALTDEYIRLQYSDQTMGIVCKRYMSEIARVSNQPTIDAVPVVRCKNCKHWSRDGNGYGDDESHCTNPDGLDNYARADDFCSYGERTVTADG